MRMPNTTFFLNGFTNFTLQIQHSYGLFFLIKELTMLLKFTSNQFEQFFIFNWPKCWIFSRYLFQYSISTSLQRLRNTHFIPRLSNWIYLVVITQCIIIKGKWASFWNLNHTYYNTIIVLILIFINIFKNVLWNWHVTMSTINNWKIKNLKNFFFVYNLELISVIMFWETMVTNQLFKSIFEIVPNCIYDILKLL